MISGLKTNLKALGLEEKEILVLSTLLESGSPMFVSAVAQASQLNRTTTYDILKELVGKGLASYIKKRGAVRYQSIAAELLPAYVERQREVLEDTKKQLAALVPQIKLVRNKWKSLPKVQFFEGIEGVKQAYEDTLENNIGKKLYDFTGTDAVYRKMGKEWLEYYWNKRSRLGIECIVLAPDTDWSAVMKSEDQKYKRTTKLIPGKFPFDSEIDIYDNKVGIFSFSQENPIAILIEDDTIAHTMKTLFDCMESLIK